MWYEQKSQLSLLKQSEESNILCIQQRVLLFFVLDYCKESNSFPEQQMQKTVVYWMSVTRNWPFCVRERCGLIIKGISTHTHKQESHTMAVSGQWLIALVYYFVSVLVDIILLRPCKSCSCFFCLTKTDDECLLLLELLLIDHKN